jgi:hypothetical protein
MLNFGITADEAIKRMNKLGEIYSGTLINAMGNNYILSTDISTQPKFMIGDLDVEKILLKLMRQQEENNVILQCEWCGQYGAVKTACRFCGKPIRTIEDRIG